MSTTWLEALEEHINQVIEAEDLPQAEGWREVLLMANENLRLLTQTEIGADPLA